MNSLSMWNRKWCWLNPDLSYILLNLEEKFNSCKWNVNCKWSVDWTSRTPQGFLLWLHIKSIELTQQYFISFRGNVCGPHLFVMLTNISVIIQMNKIQAKTRKGLIKILFLLLYYFCIEPYFKKKKNKKSVLCCHSNRFPGWNYIILPFF